MQNYTPPIEIHAIATGNQIKLTQNHTPPIEKKNSIRGAKIRIYAHKTNYLPDEGTKDSYVPSSKKTRISLIFLSEMSKFFAFLLTAERRAA